MKIVVIGGSGLIGTNLVARLRQSGNEVWAASPSSGVNTITGEGLAEALAGAQVVVDVANSPSFEDRAVLEFFETSGRNLLAAEASAGIGHHVALSVVGADRAPDSGYLRAKMAQENLIKASGIPYTILRATQFFEFINSIAESGADGEVIRLSPALFQPIAADDVAAALADLAVGSPLNGTLEVAGPEAWPLDKLARKVLAASGDGREVIADVRGRYFGSELTDRSLTPGAHPRVGPTHFADWLSRQSVQRSTKERSMSKKIVVAGSGFAGLWSAISAARAVSLAGKTDAVEVIMVSPRPALTIRPRLYEAVLENMNPDIKAVLDAAGIAHIAGTVERIDADTKQLTITLVDGSRKVLDYDRFVLATGSTLFRPHIPGLREHGFNVDTIEAAETLDAHLRALAAQPVSPGRSTVVVAGGGLTGLETATEMPERLRAIFGEDAELRVVIVDPAAEIGAELGANPLPVIREALAEVGVEPKPGLLVSAVDAEGVTLSNGERIEARTVVWTAGMRAHPLAAQVPGEHDGLGRVVGDAWLHAPASDGIFVTGDIVKAATDDEGNYSVMSCQHACGLGRVAGHNAAAELVGLPRHPYSQRKYATCVDLGRWGALYTEGWDRHVLLTRQDGKKLKQQINREWIYPPPADREAMFAVANPDYAIVP